MANLKDVLSNSAGEFLKAGGSASLKVKQALRKHRQREYRIFLFVTGLVVCGLILCVVMLLSSESQKVRVAAGVIGLGSGGGLEILRRIWKDWSQTDLLLILIEDASEAQVTTIVNKLTKKL